MTVKHLGIHIFKLAAVACFAVSLACAGTSPVKAQAAPIPAGFAEPVTTELAPGLYTFGNFGRRSIFVVTGDGVIATDPVSADFAAAMRAAISKITPAPVKYVIYSHQHWDHVSGGQIFKDEGATFISHEKCLAHFDRHPNPAIVRPDRTVAGGETIELGGRALKLMYFGPNHGDCMLVMQLDGTDVLYVNDLVTPYSLGLGMMPDYDPAEWLHTLRELEARPDWQRIVGGHGVPFGKRDAVTQRRHFIEQLMAAVKTEFDNGLNVEQMTAKIVLPEFKDVRGYDQQIGRAIERAYRFYEMGW
ncbi:MAG: MBL fold metallo-hydrolase [Rhodobacteraceae bacterium]|nr:MBL fold metallo-hydrolase [Paracoccaceae bacterium]